MARRRRRLRRSHRDETIPPRPGTVAWSRGIVPLGGSRPLLCFQPLAASFKRASSESTKRGIGDSKTKSPIPHSLIPHFYLTYLLSAAVASRRRYTLISHHRSGQLTRAYGRKDGNDDHSQRRTTADPHHHPPLCRA